METLFASRIRTGSCAATDPCRSWSPNSKQFRTTTFASEGSINRYYVPATDQFLSIDPDVQTTDEPYVFTNDDPLNETDPLGLCKGIIGCIKSATKSVVHGIESTVAKAFAKGVADQLPDNSGMTMGLCGSVSIANGVGGKASACAGSTGNGKPFASLTIGSGAGSANASIGASFELSNAQTASQLTKEFAYGGASFGSGPSATVEIEVGKTASNKDIYIVEAGLSLAAQPGFSYENGVSYTWAKNY